MERKLFAHYIDANFNSASPNYVRLGKDLEELSIEMNPNVEVFENIIGERSVRNQGYEISQSVEPYYVENDDPLSEQLWKIFNNRSTGDQCKTTVLDVLLSANDDDETDPTVVWAYREDAVVALNTVGGDTGGVQHTFDVYPCGNRVKGSFDVKTKTFTPTGA